MFSAKDKQVAVIHTSITERNAQNSYETERGPDVFDSDPFLRMYLWWSLCALYLHACQVRVTVGDSGLCCCTCVAYFEHKTDLSPQLL